MVSSLQKVVCLFFKSDHYTFFLFFIFTITSCTNENKKELPYYNTRDLYAEWIKPSNPHYSSIHKVQSFELYDQTGHMYGTDSLNGKVYIANFFFTACPIICPRMMSNLKVIQDKFGNNHNVKVVSFTVMPWNDSVKTLYSYSQIHKINPAFWHLLTGDKTKIYGLASRSYFAGNRTIDKNDLSTFIHTQSALLVDGQGRIRGVYDTGDKSQISRLCEDLKILLVSF